MGWKDYRYIVIDDHALMCRMVTTILKDQGVSTIDTAADGKTGLAKIQQAAQSNAPYDVVFLDWSMPGLNGMDVLAACRSDKTFNRTAIIMLTAESEDINIVKAMEAGATAYVTKPFKPETLIKKIEDISSWLATQAKERL